MQMPSSRLRHAIIDNNLAIVERLIRRFPELLVNADITNGWTSLHYAAYHGHFEICVYLTSLGHDLAEISFDIQGYTPLHLAAMRNHEQTIHFLAQKFLQTLDFTTNAKKTPGYTPLILATKEGHDASVNLLLDFGAEIDKADVFGNRPIHYASEYGHQKVMKSLVERGTNYKTKNKLGWSPIEYSFSIQTRSYLSAITLEIERRKEAELKKRLLDQKLMLEKPTTSLGKESSSASTSGGATTTTTTKIKTTPGSTPAATPAATPDLSKSPVKQSPV
ncbi:ankyrin repeat-containing domain protein [Lipomyces arxii]|uniref:ankyrin repeat-containing domain protein n=1 Tax=Lipomyces arxii TaxID=56418 RepID=UPI0034CE2A63